MARPAGIESRITGILDATKNLRSTTRGLVLGVAGIASLTAFPLAILQLAVAVANGEKVWVPRLTLEGPSQYRTDLLEQGWNAEDIRRIHSALSGSVNGDGGVAGAARSGKG